MYLRDQHSSQNPMSLQFTLSRMIRTRSCFVTVGGRVRASRPKVTAFSARPNYSQRQAARSTATSRHDCPPRTNDKFYTTTTRDNTGRVWLPNEKAKYRARSSGVERYIDTVEVRGSRPLAPTMGSLYAARYCGVFICFNHSRTVVKCCPIADRNARSVESTPAGESYMLHVARGIPYAVIIPSALLRRPDLPTTLRLQPRAFLSRHRSVAGAMWP